MARLASFFSACMSELVRPLHLFPVLFDWGEGLVGSQDIYYVWGKAGGPILASKAAMCSGPAFKGLSTDGWWLSSLVIGALEMSLERTRVQITHRLISNIIHAHLPQCLRTDTGRRDFGVGQTWSKSRSAAMRPWEDDNLCKGSLFTLVTYGREC